jgi:hypothetical protein
MKFHVLKATRTKLRAFWDIAPCSLVGVDRLFRGAYCLHRQGDYGFITMMMEAVRTSETSVYFNETTRRYIPEGCHLQVKLKLYFCYILSGGETDKYNTETLSKSRIQVSMLTSWVLKPCGFVRRYLLSERT